ncbi:DNA-binding transcriptional regulator, XRE-family HTH domain [Spirosomataceae bacterium TFI 002]|jgi:transcriptional regulator with XRE-family HTH domain|nr:DNA-binding transcriptional regulator, XRE-family HTH domain [Spirosomataceae bacterium TFI 002]
MKDIGIKLKRIREIFGYSQEYVAHFCNISQSAYCKKESGQRIPSLERLIQLTTLYDIDLQDLIDLDLSEISILAHRRQIEKLLKN